MEGVGARLGRSSTRYGPTTVFSGPVRKWKKRWVNLPSSSSSSSSSNHNSNGAANGSHLLLYKWTPQSQSQSQPKEKSSSDPPLEEPPRRKFKYVPVYLLEKEKKEAEEKADDEAKSSDVETVATEPVAKGGDGYVEKPDIDDVPMEDSKSQKDNQVMRQDLNESTLDLSLGLTSHDDDSDQQPDQPREGQLERANSSSAGT